MDQTLQEEIQKAFAEPVQPVRKSFLYNIGLLLVTVIMVLLPIVYFLVVVAAGFGVYYHAVHNHGIISSGGGGMRLRLLIYVGPLVIGAILVVFLARPLIPRFGRRFNPSIRDRIVVAKRNPTPGICRIKASPRALFADFAALTKNLTARFYHDVGIEHFNAMPLANYLQYCKEK